ncbi:hypothetical protein PSPO01_10123 [Paraphaeosphaeria sporulosa]
MQMLNEKERLEKENSELKGYKLITTNVETENPSTRQRARKAQRHREKLASMIKARDTSIQNLKEYRQELTATIKINDETVKWQDDALKRKDEGLETQDRTAKRQDGIMETHEEMIKRNKHRIKDLKETRSLEL